MKQHLEGNSPDNGDAALSQLLRAAMPAPQRRNPAFRTGVWQRIRAIQSAPVTWSLWLRRHPFSIGGIAAACVFLAIAGGGWLALEQSNRLREKQLTQYLASIDAHRHLAAQPGNRTLSQ